MGMELVGASVWEAELLAHLTSHEEGERDLLTQYEEAAASSGSHAFQYLTALIEEDEVRHHRLFVELASALRSDAELRAEEPAVPRLDHWGPDTARVVELTEALLEREHADAKELRLLAAHLQDVKESTLWHLLVKLMQMDTAKHIEILEFVRAHARKML
ncbi:MAG: hypothetical protein ACLQPH_16825 [Acidimicrobiales bacterium]